MIKLQKCDKYIRKRFCWKI